jgi:hypothetical protein
MRYAEDKRDRERSSQTTGPLRTEIPVKYAGWSAFLTSPQSIGLANRRQDPATGLGSAFGRSETRDLPYGKERTKSLRYHRHIPGACDVAVPVDSRSVAY